MNLGILGAITAASIPSITSFGLGRKGRSIFSVSSTSTGRGRILPEERSSAASSFISSLSSSSSSSLSSISSSLSSSSSSSSATLHSINVDWNGQSDRSPSDSTIYLQVFNRSTNLWETLDSLEAGDANVDYDMSGSITSNLSNYMDTNLFVSCRVYQEAI